MTILPPRFCALAVAVAAVAGTFLVSVPAGAASGGNDTQIVQAGVLVASDLPATWSQHPRDNSSDKKADAAAAKIASCKTYRAFRASLQAVKRSRVQSPDFELGQSTFLNTVDVFASDAAANKVLTTFNNSSIPDCVDKLYTVLFRQQIASDKTTAAQVKGITVSVEPYDIANYGDDTVAYEGSATVAFKDGTSLEIGLGNTAVRVGRAVSDYSYTVFDQAAIDALSPAVEKSVARLQAAL
jgi:hypothetical protein